MYSRKLKALRKKSKSGIKANDVGSNWGPRLALYERERELATHQQQVQKQQQQQIYQNSNTSQHHHQVSSASSGVSGSTAVASSQHYIQNPRRQQQQQHHQVVESSHDHNNDDPGNIIAGGIPPAGQIPAGTCGGSSHTNGGGNHFKGHHHQQQQPAAAGESVAAVVDVAGKQSSVIHSNNGNLSKPLTVIIPPLQQFLLSSDFGPDRDSVPSTKTWRSSSPDRHEDVVGVNRTEVQVHCQRIESPDTVKMMMMMMSSNTKPISGLLVPTEPKVREQQAEYERKAKISQAEPEKVNNKFNPRGSHQQSLLLEDEEEEEEEEEEEDEDKYEEEIDLRNCPGSAVAALKQGLAMIYVPMEQAAMRRKSTSPKKIMSPKMDEMTVEDDMISSAEGSPTAESSHTQRGPVLPLPILNELKDGDTDSLLESFDSVIFKPRSLSTIMVPNTRSNSSSSTNSPNCIPGSSRKSPLTEVQVTVELSPSSSSASSSTAPASSRLKQQISESPPPLPPLNDSMKVTGKKSDKNLRFSEQLENVQIHNQNFAHSKLRLGKKVPIPTAPNHHLNTQTSQKDAQTDVTEVQQDLKQQFPNHHHHHQHQNTKMNNSVRDDNFTVLSCGHVRTASNYSTLSSITSSLTDEEGVTRDPRSAIQQLRDLSMLIGGNFHEADLRHNSNNSDQNKSNNSDSNNNKKNKKAKRRDSQESSGTDSGKGSGASNQSPTEASPKEKTKHSTVVGGAYPPSCAFSNKGDCDDCFMVFRNPLASDSSHSSGTSPLSCPRDSLCQSHHHRHLIIQEHSRLRQSAGKIPSSHHTSSSSSHSTVPSSIGGGGHHGSQGSKKSKKAKKHKKTHELVFEYCDCRHCDCRLGRPVEEEMNSRKVNHLSQPLSRNSPANSTGSDSHSNNNNNHNNSNNNNNNLFTIDEEDIGEVVEFNSKNQTQAPAAFMDVTIKDFNSEEGKDHWHPKCWLAPDPNMGWSDLESLYSQNMKLEKPININDECWTCWREVAEFKRLNGTDSNRTIDRTKRMFIWLNKRHKEFNAPWWEAKKQASIRWLITKAFAHVPKEAIGDPFKESKKGKPKYRLKDEAIKGLVNGKLYCLVLDHLYQNQHYRTRGLTHWDIIKILSRRGVYVAQPSDMKLTEGTLRQRKPLRIAAHIALIEAIMSLYCKETLSRDRVIATLNSFGQTVDPDVSTAEDLLIAWINASMLALKSYILSNNNNKSQKLPCGRLSRWLHVPQVQEIRDLCDGIGICSLFALYCSSDLQVSDIAVPEPDDMLNIYDTIGNHTIIERLCHELFPEKIYHLHITDFLYIHGYMKQNILSFLVDLFHHLEINPINRVNRLTHVPVRVDL